MLETMNVSEDAWLPIVSATLDGTARDEFWHVHDELERQGTVDIHTIMKRLVDLFDIGMHAQLLKTLSWLRQQKGESVLVFRGRFLRIIAALRGYGYEYDEEKL